MQATAEVVDHVSQPEKNDKYDKKGRLIIRNLVFDINEGHLRKLFSKYGEIQEISLPINPTNNKPRGFAFIQFNNKNHALKAVKELNDTVYKGRKVFLDLSVSKDRYQNVGKTKSSSNQEEETKDSTLHGKNAMEIEGEASEAEPDAMSTGEIVEGEEEENSDFEEEGQDEVNVDDGEEKSVKRPPEDLSPAIFVKNVSFDTSEFQFKDFFRKFGPIFYAKLTMNQDTGRPRGTGFVKFKDASVAQKLITSSQARETAVRNGDLKRLHQSDIIDFELQGRQLVLLPCISREEASSKASQSTKMIPENETESQKRTRKAKALEKMKTIEEIVTTDKNNKRNLHLARFGTWREEDNMSQRDREVREIHNAEKIEKLKNPNYLISNTRIMIKGCPKKNFTKEDVREIVNEALHGKYTPKEMKTLKFIKKIDIPKEAEKLDENSNQINKGFVFLDFERPQDALSFLEYAKEEDGYKRINPKLVPIVEFAIEDVRELKKKEKIVAKLKKANEKHFTKDLLGNKEQQTQKKALQNQTKVTKIKILKHLKEGTGTVTELKSLLHDVHSRGLKQRLKKKIAAERGIEVEDGDNIDQEHADKGGKSENVERLGKLINIVSSNVKVAKKVAEIRAAKEERKKKVRSERIFGGGKQTMNAQERSEMQGITKAAKKSRLQKRRADEHDEFDQIAQEYQNKVRKQGKWSQ